ncbi:MAG: NADPH:quinone oxidoreductase family protein [Myxococcota bacterium]
MVIPSDDWPEGVRAQIDALGAQPRDAIDHHLRLEPQPPPSAAARKPNEVVIRVRAAGINWVDLLMTSGQYQHVPEPPYTPGLEMAGEVLWCGADVENVRVGDAVIVDGLLAGPRSLGDYRRWGGWATYAVAPAEALIRKPAALSFDAAATLLGSFETAYHVLVVRGQVQAGETVLILGATGTTGSAAVQVAKALGATVIATGRRADKLEAVRALGADHVVATDDGAAGVRRFRDDVKALTGGRGVDVVHDGLGGGVAREALRCVTFGARYLVVGWAATPFAGRGEKKADVGTLPTNLIMMKSLDVRGCPAVISAHRDPSLVPTRRSQILAWVEAGHMAPHVGGHYALSDIAEGMRAKWESRHPGVVTVRP